MTETASEAKERLIRRLEKRIKTLVELLKGYKESSRFSCVGSIVVETEGDAGSEAWNRRQVEKLEKAIEDYQEIVRIVREAA